jgi:hypothetical protein
MRTAARNRPDRRGSGRPGAARPARRAERAGEGQGHREDGEQNREAEAVGHAGRLPPVGVTREGVAANW